jgi:hypothetical protein
LAFSHFLDESSQTAAEHIAFFDMVMDQYELEMDNLVALVCDNTEPNKAISRRIAIPMIGCAAHRFNLAVKDRLAKRSTLVKKMMRKLKSVKRVAALQKATSQLVTMRFDGAVHTDY